MCKEVVISGTHSQWRWWGRSCCVSYNQKWMDEVPIAFASSDIQSFPTRDERPSVFQLYQKQHN